MNPIGYIGFGWLRGHRFVGALDGMKLGNFDSAVAGRGLEVDFDGFSIDFGTATVDCGRESLL